jgi:hypothetical protein
MKILKAIIALSLASLALAAPSTQRRDNGDFYVDCGTFGMMRRPRQSGGDTGTSTDNPESLGSGTA